MNNLLDFKEELLSKAGASFNPIFGTTPIQGYMVSVRPEIKTEIKNESIDLAIGSIIGDYCIELSTENYFLGAWIDKNICYFDLSFNTNSLAYAVELGILNNQFAIYDIQNSKCINLPSPQTSGTESQKIEYARLKAKEIIDSLNK